MNASFELSRYQRVYLLRPGNLLSEHTNKQILKATDVCMSKGYVDFIIDMSGVQYINSVGLNLLIMLRERCQARGGQLIIVQASDTVMKLLTITRLDSIFHLVGSLERALGKLEVSPDDFSS